MLIEQKIQKNIMRYIKKVQKFFFLQNHGKALVISFLVKLFIVKTRLSLINIQLLTIYIIQEFIFLVARKWMFG